MPQKIIFFFIILLFCFKAPAQELNAQVIVNADLVNQTNQQIFQTLEQSLNEFINTRIWTTKPFLNREKIACSFLFTLTSYSGNQFKATLQVQSQRPIFETNYDSPILNYLDKEVVFTYQEYQPLFYNQSEFESNLVSTISYYVYIILGLDADSFEPLGGSPYYEQAQQIVNLAQQTDIAAWKPNTSNRNRHDLIDNLRSNTFREFRTTLYQYHRKGLDQMITDALAGKEAIMSAINELQPLFNRRPNAFLLQLFFDAKVDEIVNLFSDGPPVDFEQTNATLKKIAPFFGARWKQIKS
jgi:hypothetical protein